MSSATASAITHLERMLELLENQCDVVDPSPISVKLWILLKGFIPLSIDWCNCLSMHIKRISNAVNTNLRLSFQ